MSPLSLSHPEWDMSIQSYVLRTNYDEYAVILMKKKSSFGPSTTLKLYGTTGCGTCGQAGSGLGPGSSEKTPPKGPKGPLALRDLPIALAEVPWTSLSSALQRLRPTAQLRAVSPSEGPTTLLPGRRVAILTWKKPRPRSGRRCCLSQLRNSRTALSKPLVKAGQGQWRRCWEGPGGWYWACLQLPELCGWVGGWGAACRLPPMPGPLTACSPPREESGATGGTHRGFPAAGSGDGHP